MDTADKETGATLAGGFRIGDLRVDPRTGDVSGAGGSEQLDPKVMGVLVMLAERVGEVVSRDELLARLWPDVVVTDDALSRCLYDLRRQLATASGDEAVRAAIETLPKRGYRLNAEVAPVEVRSPPRPGRRRAWLAVGALALAAAAVIGAVRYLDQPPVARVAVLPFVDMSESQDQAYLADGIAEEITDRLSQSEGLKVTARTSSFSFRAQAIDVAKIARKLDVTHVLEGSIRKSGKRIRVTAQLIAASDSAHVWSESYDRNLDDVFAIQDEIALAVAAELRARLTGTKARRTTDDVDALVQFAQGEHFYQRREPGDLERARQAYERAVAIDPDYARAWAALAAAYSLLADATHPRSKALHEKAGEAARRAVELDPTLPEAHIRLGKYYLRSADNAQANRHFEEARRLEPGHPLALSYYADEALARGDLDSAIAYLRQAVAVDPMALVYRRNLAITLLGDEQYEAAISEFESLRDNYSQPDPDSETDMVRALVGLGRFADAESVIAGMPEGRLKDHSLAILVEAPGKRAEADAALARLAASPNEIAHVDEILETVRLAEAYAIRSRIDEAFAALLLKKRTLETRDGVDTTLLWSLMQESRISPLLKPLRADPRWRELMHYEWPE